MNEENIYYPKTVLFDYANCVANGRINEEQLEELIYDFIINNEIAESLKFVKSFSKNIKKLDFLVESATNKILKKLQAEKKSDVDEFLDQFTTSRTMSKLEAHELSGLAISTINIKAKSSCFANLENGPLYLRSFLEWLKIFNNKKYLDFQKMYNHKYGKTP